MSTSSRLRQGALNPAEWLAQPMPPHCGGLAQFVGTVRNAHEGRAVTGIHYHAHAALAERRLAEIEAEAARRFGVEIDVVKRIPMGAGLGGGSSDAATCLVALNRLWGLGLTPVELAQLGLKLGADVPVFIHGRAAWAEGVGERLTPLFPPDAPSERNYLIVKPNVFVSTAEIFQDPELTRNSPTITIHGFLASGGRNDCLGVVRRRYPQVADALDWLSLHGTARLTGTGACVFLGLETMDRGREILSGLPPSWAGFLVRGVNDSPLLARLSADC